MPICIQCNYQFDLDRLCSCKCGKCDEGLTGDNGTYSPRSAPSDIKETSTIRSTRPTCEGSATGLGGIKIRTSSVAKEGFCNFCNLQKDKIYVIEGGRAKFILCVNCFTIIRNQWNREIADPKERWME